MAKLLINAGCGPKGSGRVPTFFDDWQQVRVDADPTVAPDVLSDILDIGPVATGSADAVWSAHCIEHLYEHQVGQAFAEFHRILRDDGFICILVPDLQTVAARIAADQLHEVLYQSPAGPITAHDVVFGFGAAIAQGRHGMAHRCGFTPTAMMRRLAESAFSTYVLRRLPSLELMVVARKQPWPEDSNRETLLRQLTP